MYASVVPIEDLYWRAMVISDIICMAFIYFNTLQYFLSDHVLYIANLLC